MKKWDWNINRWNWLQKLIVAFIVWLVILLPSWYLIPGWKDKPAGFLTLAGVVAVVVITYLPKLVAYLKQSKSETPSQTIHTEDGPQINVTDR